MMWSLRDASRELQIDVKTLAKHLAQLGIEPRMVGVRKLITDDDLDRVRETLPRTRHAYATAGEVESLARRVEAVERRLRDLERA